MKKSIVYPGMRHWTVTVVFIWLCGMLSAQSPYTIRWDKELYFTASGAAVLGTGMYLRSRITLFTPEELERLDNGYVNEIDRAATIHLSRSADRLSDHFLNTSQLMPALFLAGKHTRNHFGQIAAMYGETVLINTGFTALTKYAIRRPRPFVYNGDVNLSRIQSVNAQASFVSGHTSSTAAATFFMARVYADFYPESRWRPVVWTAAAIVPAVTGYLRFRAGSHYPTDIIGGYALGAAIGYLVPCLHRTPRRHDRDLGFSAGPSSLHLQLQF